MRGASKWPPVSPSLARRINRGRNRDGRRGQDEGRVALGHQRLSFRGRGLWRPELVGTAPLQPKLPYILDCVRKN